MNTRFPSRNLVWQEIAISMNGDNILTQSTTQSCQGKNAQDELVGRTAGYRADPLALLCTAIHPPARDFLSVKSLLSHQAVSETDMNRA